MGWIAALGSRSVRSGMERAKSSGLLWQIGLAHQIAVALAGGATAFIEGPDNEALAAPTVARGKDAGDTGCIGAVLCFDIGTLVTMDTQLLEQLVFGSEETHGQQSQLAGDDLFCAGNLLGHKPALLILLPFDLDNFHFLETILLV